MRPIGLLFPLALLAFSTSVSAEPVQYEIDPAHTYPSFAADHMGISVWRGKFNHTTGTVTLDRAAKAGHIRIVVDMASVDFGHAKLNEHVLGKDMFNVAKYPKAIYEGELIDFVNGAPTQAVGHLSLHGVTRPLDLKIRSFKCIPMFTDKSRKRCGADAIAHFERDAFGLDGGKNHGFDMTVTPRIQVEALESK
ncbi:MAG: YceI family protein [Gammaproteobacteria bacterium]|nr:YceI family protein [Gammaproteobacteria bacterium]